MDLKNLIEPRVDLPRLSKDLAESGHFARVWSVRQWTRANMAALWEAAKGFRSVGLEDFVPSSVAPLVEVIHEGTNSLPVLTHFQKCFCRPSDPAAAGTLVGLNRQTFSSFTGPGYYVTHSSTETGEVDFDYTMRPTEKSPDWPDIVSNRSRLGVLVYYGLVDVMRGLAPCVSIGRAKRKGDWLDNWFVLVRQEVRQDLSPSPGTLEGGS